MERTGIYAMPMAEIHFGYQRFVAEIQKQFQTTKNIIDLNQYSVVRHNGRPSHCVFNVQNIDELKELRRNITESHIFTCITITHTKVSSKFAADAINISEGDFAILLDPSHVDVQKHLEEAFRNATEYFLARKNFCIEIDFSNSLICWYMESFGDLPGCDEYMSTRVKSAKFFITNHTVQQPYQLCGPQWLCCLVMQPSYHDFYYRDQSDEGQFIGDILHMIGSYSQYRDEGQSLHFIPEHCMVQPHRPIVE